MIPNFPCLIIYFVSFYRVRNVLAQKIQKLTVVTIHSFSFGGAKRRGHLRCQKIWIFVPSSLQFELILLPFFLLNVSRSLQRLLQKRIQSSIFSPHPQIRNCLQGIVEARAMESTQISCIIESISESHSMILLSVSHTLVSRYFF